MRYRRAVAIRPIRLLGDPVLRTPAAPVVRFDHALRTLVSDLVDTLHGVPGRAGVAAPQIGVSLRVFVFAVEGHEGHVVNPTLATAGPAVTEPEGCLSLPDLSFPTPRARDATVHGWDRHGAPVTHHGSGAVARALQHEYDHLDGRVYVDVLPTETRREAMRAVRVADWGGHRH